MDSEMSGLVEYLDFSLCCVVITLDGRKKSEIEVSADLMYCC